MSAVALTKPPPSVAGLELTEPPVAGTGSGAQAGMELTEPHVAGTGSGAQAGVVSASDRAACAAAIRSICGVLCMIFPSRVI